MSRPERRAILALLAAALSTLIAAAAAWNLFEIARTVDVVAVFAGAFGAGASVAVAVRELRDTRARRRAAG